MPDNADEDDELELIPVKVKIRDLYSSNASWSNPKIRSANLKQKVEQYKERL